MSVSYTHLGISGTRFDRPGFLAMMEEVEAGRVEAIVIKDMSRLGRDYLKAVSYTHLQREGKYIFYELNASVLDEALLWLTDLRGGE